jgi:hypothetical protein
MQGARQVGFSATIWKISSRISLVTSLLPTGLRTREINRQIQMEARTMPTHNGIGRHDDECCLPQRPKAEEEHPEDLVRRGQSGTGVLAFENHQLLT